MSSTMFPNSPVWQPTLEQPAQATKTAAAPKIKLNPENVRNGLAQLVLTLVELIRELLERQALRRIEAGTLTEAEIERLGQTFCKLSDEIGRLKEYFGLSDEDLNLDLGPLGKLR
ncbi:MAG: gas vesicle protein K [Thermoguttaceae bacterium]